MNLTQKIKLKYTKLCEIIRFLIIGGIATLIDMFVMSLIIYFSNKSDFNNFIKVFIGNNSTSGLIIALASSIGFITGLIFNYIFSYKFVYTGDNSFAKTKKGFIVFTLLSFIGFLIHTIGMAIGYGILNINEWIIKIILTLVVLLFNYITRKKIIFNKKKAN